LPTERQPLNHITVCIKSKEEFFRKWLLFRNFNPFQPQKHPFYGNSGGKSAQAVRRNDAVARKNDQKRVFPTAMATARQAVGLPILFAKSP